MKYAIIFYSVLTIAMGILCFLTVKDEKMEKSDRVTFKGIGELLKMPAVWIIGLVTFCNYVFTLSIYYFTPYLTEILGATATFAAALAASKRWVSLFGSVGGGFLSDKVGAGRLLFVSFIAMAAGIVAMLLLPQNSSSIIIFTVLFIVVYIFYNVNYAQTWAMMDEGAIPERLSGSAAGLISTVGYLPEIFISLLAGITLDKYPGFVGYRNYFIFVVVMLLLGAVMVTIWMNLLKKKRQKEEAK